MNKNIQNQKIKIAAFIKTRELRSDGIKIKVHIKKLEKWFVVRNIYKQKS